jgi:hypothetical protein
MGVVRIQYATCDQPGCQERIDIPAERAHQPFIYLIEQGWKIFPETLETYCPRGTS